MRRPAKYRAAQDEPFQFLRITVTAFTYLVILIVGTAGQSLATSARSSEEIWKDLERLTPLEREKRLVEGAKNEGEMIWYTNSGLENATRYVQAFKKHYPFIDAQVWRSKQRQVIQRIIAEANDGRHIVDVIKP